MAYLLYKLKFPNGIHIGSAGSLETTSVTVHSDTFFSALYSEYMKIYDDNKFYNLIESGTFKISDLFPYKDFKTETSFYLPKPFVSIDRKIKEKKKNEEKIDRKKVMALDFIPASRLKEYFSFLEDGENFPEIDNDFGEKQIYTKNKISRTDKDTELYNIEVFKFNKNSGLYFIVELSNNIMEEWEEKINNLLESLALTGIGGKKSAGFGQFEIEEDALLFDGEDFDSIISEDDAFINKSLFSEKEIYLLLSTYAPLKEEISKLKEDNNCYQLIKRSGFINQKSYSDEAQKMKQVYMLSAGSTLNFKAKGRIVDLNLHGKHSIYRMGKPIVMGVDLWEK